MGFIPEGRDGTYTTLAYMACIVRQYKVQPWLRELAIGIVANCYEKDWRGEVDCLFRFVRDRIRYVQDVDNIETLSTPDVTLRLMAGDCDDKSVLLASLLGSIGHRARFVAMGWAKDPGIFEHVCVETKIGAIWVNCETTEQFELGQLPDPLPTNRMTVYC